MSYILDALKRSQQERELGQTPTLFAESQLQTEPPHKTNRAVFIALALALLAVFISFYAAFGNRLLVAESEGPALAAPIDDLPAGTPANNETEQRQLPLPPKKQPAIESLPVVISDTKKPVTARNKINLPAVKDTIVETERLAVKDEPAMASTDTRTATGTYREELLKLKQRLEQKDSEIKPNNVAKRSSPPENINTPVPSDSEVVGEINRPLAEQQLAASFRSRLPSRDISVHVYSDNPAERFVFVNSRKMMEGERTSEELTVEEIHPDGIVFSFDGQRFFKPL